MMLMNPQERFELWKKASWVRDPECKGDHDPNDPICRICSRSQVNIDLLLKEIGSNLPFSVEIISCEKEQKEITEEKSRLQNDKAYLDEEEQKLAAMKLELEKRESLFQTKKAELAGKQKNFSEKMGILSVHRAKRIAFRTPDGPEHLDIAHEAALARERHRIPGTESAPSKKETIDFTKMGRIVFHTESTGMGLRRLDDNGTSPNIASVIKTVPEFPKGHYYPIDVISQENFEEMSILKAIVNFDGTKRIDSMGKDKAEIVISVKKRIL